MKKKVIRKDKTFTTENTECTERQLKVFSCSVMLRVFRGNIPKILSFQLEQILTLNLMLKRRFLGALS